MKTPMFDPPHPFLIGALPNEPEIHCIAIFE
jgi:hypothetical protein